MQPAYLNDEHLERLRSLMSVNHKIVIENHIRDYSICHNYFTYGVDVNLFEDMLCSALTRVERKLKYGRKKLYIFDDYHDIYGEVVEITLKKAAFYTPLEISQRYNKPVRLIQKILNQAIANLRKYYKS